MEIKCKNCGKPKANHYGRSYNWCGRYEEKKDDAKIEIIVKKSQDELRRIL